MERELNILAIDDEQIVLDSVKKHLRKENFSLHLALSVKEALALMDTIPMDVVLTDLMMPETDGLEMLRIMRERASHTPVIMITGYATINTALQATNLGAFDYVAKPFTKSELVSVVKRAADLVRAGDAKAAGRVAEPEAEVTAETAPEVPVGEYGWKRLDDDGTVLLGARSTFLEAIGGIQNIFLPVKGDELRQGSVFLRVFASDLRSHTVLSPLSGEVTDINEKYLADPAALVGRASEDWLVRLKPSKLELELSELGIQ